MNSEFEKENMEVEDWITSNDSDIEYTSLDEVGIINGPHIPALQKEGWDG